MKLEVDGDVHEPYSDNHIARYTYINKLYTLNLHNVIHH